MGNTLPTSCPAYTTCKVNPASFRNFRNSCCKHEPTLLLHIITIPASQQLETCEKTSTFRGKQGWGLLNLSSPYRTQYGELGPLVAKFLGIGNIGGRFSSLNWMKNMGIGIGNTTGGVALIPHNTLYSGLGKVYVLGILTLYKIKF